MNSEHDFKRDRPAQLGTFRRIHQELDWLEWVLDLKDADAIEAQYEAFVSALEAWRVQVGFSVL